jgi:hypothetical protein
LLKENFVRHGKFHAANILPPGTDLVGVIRSSSAMTPMRVFPLARSASARFKAGKTPLKADTTSISTRFDTKITYAELKGWLSRQTSYRLTQPSSERVPRRYQS